MSLVFITKSYSSVPRNIRLNYTHYFIIKISEKECLTKLHLIIYQILSLKTFNLYRISTVTSYSFLVINATLTSDIPLRLRKNISERI